MTWLEFWELVCKVSGSAGLTSFDYTLPEMAAIAEGRDRASWRHTMLLYDAGMNKNPKAFRECYPYMTDFDKGLSETAHKKSVQAIKVLVKGRKRSNGNED